jgi:hypothetical protein
MRRLYAFFRSELGGWTYLVFAAVVYGIYCKAEGIVFVTFRRQVPVSTAEIVLVAALSMPILIALFLRWRR